MGKTAVTGDRATATDGQGGGVSGRRSFRQAVDLGVGLEELTGVLFWKAKDMLLKNNFRKLSEKELKNLTSKISYLLPEARQKGIDAEIAFEQFLLEVF